MDENECSLCGLNPYSTLYIRDLVTECPCGNTVKLFAVPAIYLGVLQSKHMCIIPFPGCTVCGRPMNLPWSIGLKCQSEIERAKQFREVYHNYGQRN